MKHTLRITLLLIAFFVLSQVFGLFLIARDAQVNTSIVDNQTVTAVSHADTAMGPRPETTGYGSLLYILIGVTIGTILVLVLVRFKKTTVWKVWYFLAVWVALSISFGVLLKFKLFFEYDVAIMLALFFAGWKIYRPGIIIHNLTEICVYAGIALLLVPIITLWPTIVLLLLISLYDAWAVWRSKHMVSMAKFQSESKVFAGILIPYSLKQSKDKNIQVPKETKTVSAKTAHAKLDAKTHKPLKEIASEKHGMKTAILGGGDVAFPLIFTGVVFENLITQGLTKTVAFWQSSIIILTTTIALGFLFVFAKKDHFYPAMPFITAGCLFGYAIVWLI